MKLDIRRRIEERFDQLLKKLLTEIDLEAIERDVRNLRRKKPKASREELARHLTHRAAMTTAAVGAGAGAPGGAIGILAMAPDIFNLVMQQSRLILSIALLYDQKPDRETRFREVLATLAISTGASATRRGVRYLIARGVEGGSAKALAKKIGGRFIARKLPAIAPIVGSVAGAGLNYLAVHATGKVATDYYRGLYQEQKKSRKAATAAPAAAGGAAAASTSKKKTSSKKPSAKPSSKKRAASAKSSRKSSAPTTPRKTAAKKSGAAKPTASRSPAKKSPSKSSSPAEKPSSPGSPGEAASIPEGSGETGGA